jgi:hypothetical protein
MTHSEMTQSIRFRIHHARGRVEELATESPRVLIGRGAHCDVRLDTDEACLEHVLILVTPAGLRATARSLDPPPRLDGVEFTDAPVRGEAVLAIGATRIELSSGAVTPSESTRPSSQRRQRLYAYLLFGVVGLALICGARLRRESRTATAPPAPDLWGQRAGVCPQASRDEARATAAERLRLALAKQERSPFHPEDGVAAVRLYQVAVACLRAASMGADADDAAANADRIRRQMDEAFRAHRLRLQRALALQNWTSAKRETGILLSFLSGSDGEYATWLSNLRRKIQVSYGSRAE